MKLIMVKCVQCNLSFRGRGNFWRLSEEADLRDGRGRGKNRNYIDASRFRDYEEYR